MAIGHTLWIQAAALHLLNLVHCVANVLTLADLNVFNCWAVPSPGFQEAAGFVLPVFRHCEQLLQASHGFLHRRMRSQAHPLVDEPPHGLQGQGGRLSAGLLHSFQPAGLFQPHSQTGQLGQLHVEVKADVQQTLDLCHAGNFVPQDLVAVLLEVFDAIQQLLNK